VLYRVHSHLTICNVSLPVGTYATQSALTEAAPASAAAPQRRQTLRVLLLDGDAFTGCVLASTLTKLVRWRRARV
jgi:hypothetical protein